MGQPPSGFRPRILGLLRRRLTHDTGLIQAAAFDWVKGAAGMTSWLVILVTSRLQDLAQVVVAARDLLQMRVADTPGVLNCARRD